MKKTDLKKILKPLVKQCVKEVLLEEGVLSSVVSEVVVGLSPLLVENKNNSMKPTNEISLKQQKLLEQQRQELEEEKTQTIKEQKIKILNATGFGSEVFDGVEPLAFAGTPDSNPPTSALAGTAPSDAGIDISGIIALGGNRWNKLV